MGSFGCAHEVDGLCKRVNMAYCEAGMRGCVLYGKVDLKGRQAPMPRWPESGEAEPAPRGGPPERPR